MMSKVAAAFWAMAAAGAVAAPAQKPSVTVDKLGGQTVTTPMPGFAPQASATLVVCTPVKTSTLSGTNAGAGENALPGSAVVSYVTGEIPRDIKQLLRLRFGAGQLKAALGTAGPSSQWGPEYSYDVLNDAPEDFTAVKTGSAQIGMMQSLAMNRVTGTAMLTMLVASLPSGAHPMASATFYTCEPAREP
jgi:hypothetical protein